MIENPFVILGYGRSGSTTFRYQLSRHPNIHAYGELFRPKDGRTVNGRNYVSGVEPVSFLEDCVYASPNEHGKRTVGFKLFFYHARDSETSYRLWPYLRSRRDIKVIFLFRRNLFDSYVSQVRAKKSDQFSIRKTEGASASHRAPFKVDLLECREHMKRRSQAKARLQEIFEDHETHTVDFENLFADPQTTMSNVYSFLGEEPFKVKMRDKKLNKVPHREGITNYPEVVRHFSHSLFADYFDLTGLSEADLKKWPINNGP